MCFVMVILAETLRKFATIWFKLIWPKYLNEFEFEWENNLDIKKLDCLIDLNYP